jgi:hypothetical protein
MQKVAFDHEVASPSTTNDPPLRAVLAWRNSAESIRTHELLLRYESPSTARSPEPSSASNNSEPNHPNLQSAPERRQSNPSRYRHPRGNRPLRNLKRKAQMVRRAMTKKVSLRNEPSNLLKQLSLTLPPSGGPILARRPTPAPPARADLPPKERRTKSHRTLDTARLACSICVHPR